MKHLLRNILVATLLPLSFTITLAQESRPDGNTGIGFFVKNGKIYDDTGSEFKPLGFNTSVHWRPGEAECKRDNMSSNIPKSGANAVRIVTQTQGAFGWNTNPTDQTDLVDRAVQNQMVPMLEMHDATCDDPIEVIVNYWTSPEMIKLCQEYERYMWVNVANEHNFSTFEAWRDDYIEIIKKFRRKGIRNLIVLDAGKNCGQNPEMFMKYGMEVLNADPQKNVVFSIHMYGYWRTNDKSFTDWTPPYSVEDDLPALKEAGLPVIVGEFGWDEPVATDSTAGSTSNYSPDVLVDICEQNDIGWFAWAFYDSPDVQWYSMLKDVCGGIDSENRTEAGDFFIPYLQENADTANAFSVSITDYLSAIPSDITISGSGGSEDISIGSNTDWTASTDEDWLSLSETSGSGDAVITVSASGSDTERSGMVTIEASDISRSIMINQSDFLNVSPSSFSFSGVGGSDDIMVNSNRSWTASSDSESWIELSTTSSDGDGTITVKVSENTMESSRSGNVTIEGGDITKTITVEQSAETSETLHFEGEDNTDASGGTSRTEFGATFYDFGGNGSYAEWDNINAAGGEYDVVFRYANGSEVDRQCELSVNGVKIDNIPFAPTDDWSNWVTTEPLEITLKSGLNVIRLTVNTDDGGPNFDYGEVSGGGNKDEETVTSLSDPLGGINIYPNPSNGMFTVEGLANFTIVRITDIRGGLVRKMRLKGNTLDMTDLPKGIYLVNVQNHIFKLINK